MHRLTMNILLDLKFLDIWHISEYFSSRKIFFDQNIIDSWNEYLKHDTIPV